MTESMTKTDFHKQWEPNILTATVTVGITVTAAVTIGVTVTIIANCVQI